MYMYLAETCQSENEALRRIIAPQKQTLKAQRHNQSKPKAASEAGYGGSPSSNPTSAGLRVRQHQHSGGGGGGSGVPMLELCRTLGFFIFV